MAETWGRSIEQVLLVAAESKIRVLGVVSPDSNSGVTTLCQQLADASHAAGWRTLLANFSQPAGAGSDDGWHPGDGPPRIVQSNRHAFDILRVRTSLETRSLFNNVDALKQTFADDLKSYDRIIVDLPAVLDWTPDMPNPVAAARACDSVVLVCMAARSTKGRVRSALSALDAVSVRLDGLILNDHYNPSLGERVAARAQKLSWLPQRLTGWIGGKARASDTLNTPL